MTFFRIIFSLSDYGTRYNQNLDALMPVLMEFSIEEVKD